MLSEEETDNMEKHYEEKLGLSEQALQVANDDIAYLKRSLEHAKRNAESWHARAEGCMAEKDELLTQLDALRPTSPPSGRSDKDWETVGNTVMALMDLVKMYMDNVRPGMSDATVIRLQLDAANALLALGNSLPLPAE